MIKRLALVAWWLGALVGASCAVIAIGALLKTSDPAEMVPAIGIGAFLTACSWTVAFILGGSFWKPPKP